MEARRTMAKGIPNPIEPVVAPMDLATGFTRAKGVAVLLRHLEVRPSLEEPLSKTAGVAKVEAIWGPGTQTMSKMALVAPNAWKMTPEVAWVAPWAWATPKKMENKNYVVGGPLCAGDGLGGTPSVGDGLGGAGDTSGVGVSACRVLGCGPDKRSSGNRLLGTHGEYQAPTLTEA
ncbi:unnamed protein product [Ilex paraguariensis]|uniref:Uncharacterized protein n=1 Tax=Ilex paraguariensis TaxID=185542 RepID=A0ABC8RGG1_9AQUA